MPETTIVPETLVITGLVPTYIAANSTALGGSKFALVSGNSYFIYIKNVAAGGNSICTINSVANCDQGFDHDVAITVADGAEKIIGPFGFNTRFKNASGDIHFDIDEVTNVTVAVVKVPLA